MGDSICKRIYAYKVTSDTGNAPCAQDGLLTLSCCKGGRIIKGKVQSYGMRKQIGIAFNNNNNEEYFLLGIYRRKALFFARIDEVISMEEYNRRKFDTIRKDQIYDYNEAGNPTRNKNNKLFHPASNEAFLLCDNAGIYAVLCKEFVYYGECSDPVPDISEYNASFTAHENRYFKLFTGTKANSIFEMFSTEISKGKIGEPHDSLKKCNSKGCFQK